MYNTITTRNVPIKMWTIGVPVDDYSLKQLFGVAELPFIFKHVAVMPDVHAGKGSTIGSVIPTQGVVMPAAVGVDIGCGMNAIRTTLTSSDLTINLPDLRHAIESAVPHGRTVGKGYGRDNGRWTNTPANVDEKWALLEQGFQQLIAKYPRLRKANQHHHLGTLGTGNHFVEISLDETDHVWIVLHSGSRGIGNAIGKYFIELAKEDRGENLAELPSPDLAYFEEGSERFDDYVNAVSWAQKFASLNRDVMVENVIAALRRKIDVPFSTSMAINCHHNYVQKEHHFGEDVYITRKGAVSARSGEYGIIPGSMGARSYIVRGLGNEESFTSCSHGAGRVMSRTKAREMFSVEDQINATVHVECRKDANVIDEIPMAYKDIDAVMNAQSDLVEIVHTLRQIICVKG
ncbi:RtcB family protein [Escherichia coli]|nr:RtcB family protein [Escherichia coli]EIB8314451.1 RtcB family protein [Escherichia coli]ELS9459247.1 RtcB family protein [Escherichia coli]ELW1472437.1 RtcB family protein [Escherichia coli]ELY7481026.1 RtcB family protein [Escherichia coli]